MLFVIVRLLSYWIARVHLSYNSSTGSLPNLVFYSLFRVVWESAGFFLEVPSYSRTWKFWINRCRPSCSNEIHRVQIGSRHPSHHLPLSSYIYNLQSFCFSYSVMQKFLFDVAGKNFLDLFLMIVTNIIMG